MVVIQDSNHRLKTMHNNMFSGARVVVLGNYMAMYAVMHEVPQAVHYIIGTWRSLTGKMIMQRPAYSLWHV